MGIEHAPYRARCTHFTTAPIAGSDGRIQAALTTNLLNNVNCWSIEGLRLSSFGLHETPESYNNTCVFFPGVVLCLTIQAYYRRYYTLFGDTFCGTQ